ncbi:MAG: glutamate 5-kinase [Nitrospirae bacterium RBG_16_64_22]|nr:MAG: glutamate 5-kinase [Nitrospirae bacterium RBG_16_64_22]
MKEGGFDLARFLSRPRRIVIKVGSRVLATRAAGLSSARIRALAGQVAGIRANGHSVVIVSSGAIAAGIGAVRPASGRPVTIQIKQAAAAVGQSRLMWAYEQAFRQNGIHTAQILLTAEDLGHRGRYMNARRTFETLLSRGILPIVNENDTVAVEEIRFGDNDTLAGLVAPLVGADLVVLLSDVEGLFTADPRRDAKASLIPFVPRVTAEVERLAGGARTSEGTGGMVSKVRTAKRVTLLGIPMAIVSGLKSGRLTEFLSGSGRGTLFVPEGPEGRGLSRRKGWMAHTPRPRGTIHVDAGARKVLVEGGKSLLPSGIVGAEGPFGAGDLVNLAGPDGEPFARGLSNYKREEVDRIRGAKSGEVEKILGAKRPAEVVHRDNLVIIGESVNR